MKSFNLIFLVIATFFSAQNTRIIYEYKYKPDSTQIDSLKTEWMYLDIHKDKSTYYSKTKFDKDSIMIDAVKKQLAFNSRNISISEQRSSGEVSYSVEKILPEYQIFLNTNIDNDKYRVAEDRKIVWKIHGDKDKIETYNVQKATTELGGRKWIAWFTSEIPFQDGPYKFCGLPGLILKIEDDTKSHSMTMKAIKKFEVAKTQEIKSDKLPSFFARKPIDVTRKQYIAQLEKYQKDPVQGMREMLSMPNSRVKININGQEFSDPKEVLKQMEKSAREEMKSNNNQIELKP